MDTLNSIENLPSEISEADAGGRKIFPKKDIYFKVADLISVSTHETLLLTGAKLV